MMVCSNIIRPITEIGVQFIKKEILANGYIDSFPKVYFDKDTEKYTVLDGNHRITALQQLATELPSKYGEFSIKCHLFKSFKGIAGKGIAASNFILFI